MKSTIQSVLAQIPATDEFAYLSITSKPEFIVRDFVAAKLHLSSKDHIVAREWNCSVPGVDERKKVDLAILDRTGKPKALIEFKASITEDIYYKECHSLFLSLKSDLDRLEKINLAPSLGILTVVHIANPEMIVEAGVTEATAKYLKDFLKFSARNILIEDAIDRTASIFRSWNFVVNSVECPLGAVWGTQVVLKNLIISR